MKSTRAHGGRARAPRPRIVATLFATYVLWSLLPTSAFANPIDDALEKIGDGKLRFEYAARPGVYGNGHNVTIRGQRDDDDWDWAYEPGPVRVVLTVNEGTVARVKHAVGSRWSSTPRNTTDLGAVPPADAVAFLMELASDARASVAEDAIAAAALADAEVWPQLLVVARERNRPSEVRKRAVFWLGQAAADAVVGDLDDMAMDEDDEIEVREAAVFAISQRPEDESVPTLIRIARSDAHPRIRKSALFWLSQTDDPRVVAFFEEVLTDR